MRKLLVKNINDIRIELLRRASAETLAAFEKAVAEDKKITAISIARRAGVVVEE